VVRRALGRIGIVALAVGAGACSAVLGLNDYGDAPADGGSDGHAGSSSGAGGGDALSPGDDAPTGADAPSPTPDAKAEAGPDGAGDDAEADDVDDAAVDALASDGSPYDVAPTDALVDAAYVAPPGWRLVAFADSSQTTCPAGFGAPLDVVFDPATATPTTGACSCGSCGLTTAPSCVTGSIGGSYDAPATGAAVCATASTALANASPGGCNTDEPKSSIGAVDVLWNAPAATGGTCTSGPPTADPTRVTFASQGRICASATDAGLPGAASSPFALCIVSAGTNACPAGPLAVAHRVGTGATIACSASCTCTPTATCTGGAVTYYTAGNCSGRTFVMPADGQCNAENGASTTYYSYKYTATLSNPSCTPGGTSTATVTGLASEQTVCCAQ
jgi:hypothetical protein